MTETAKYFDVIETHVSPWGRPTVHTTRKCVSWCLRTYTQMRIPALSTPTHKCVFHQIWVKHLKMSPFRWRPFCRCTMLSLVHECFRKWHPNPEDLFGLHFKDVMFSLGNFWEASSASCLLCTHKALSKANLHICLLHMCNASKSGLGKFWYNSFGYSLEKLERLYLFVVVVWFFSFSEFHTSECPIDFHDFQEQIW